MEDLKLLCLEELIEAALRDHLVDACEMLPGAYDGAAGRVLIVQGSLRVELCPTRAHAFLRGVIRGMSRHRHLAAQIGRPRLRPALARPEVPAGVTRGEDVPDGAEMLDSFRRHLLSKWWSRYESAGCPLSRSERGLIHWIQYNTAATVN